MLIGELARATGATPRALRYYEDQGLLVPTRTANGYRSYAPCAVRVVTTIRLLLDSGLTTDDLRSVRDCLADGLADGHRCADQAKTRLFERRLALLQRRIGELTATRDRLRDRLADVRPEPAEMPAALPGR